MRVTNTEGGRRVTSSLSSSVFGIRSGHLDRASGVLSSFPGTWINFRSKSARSNSHQACLLFSFLGSLK